MSCVRLNSMARNSLFTVSNPIPSGLRRLSLGTDLLALLSGPFHGLSFKARLPLYIGVARGASAKFRPEPHASGKWLHMIGVRKSPGCELCRGERRKDKASDEALPLETVSHLQNTGCKAQKKSVIGTHNRCWGYLRGSILMHGEAKRNLEFIGGGMR